MTKGTRVGSATTGRRSGRRAALALALGTGAAWGGLASAAAGAAAGVDDGVAVIERAGVPAPVSVQPGDATRGRAIVASRQTGLCLLCHAGPFDEAPQQGSLGPSLAGVGSRLTANELRLRIADGRRLNPQSVMPSYGRVDGLQHVGSAWAGRPLLTPQQIEDVVACLQALR